MPTYQLYHIANPLMLATFYAVTHAGEARQYSVEQQRHPSMPVSPRGEVAAPNPKAVFDLTNHEVRQSNWAQNPGVTVRTPVAVRSTSVGDVVVAPDGTPWICAPFGWRRIAPNGSISA